MARTNSLLASVHKKVSPVSHEMEQVMAAFDTKQTGYLSTKELLAACASLGVVLNDKELQTLMPLLTHDDSGNVQYKGFLDIFSSKQ